MEGLRQLKQRVGDAATDVSKSTSSFVAAHPKLQRVVDEFRGNSLAYLTILATFGGLIFGLAIGSAQPSDTVSHTF